METKRGKLLDRANELLVEIQDLEEQLDRNENYHAAHARVMKQIQEKRRELNFIRSIVENQLLGKV